MAGNGLQAQKAPSDPHRSIGRSVPMSAAGSGRWRVSASWRPNLSLV